MSKTKSLVYGLVLGSSIAAAVTLLTAPVSGRDLRGRMREQAADVKEVLANLLEDGIRLKKQIRQTSKESAVLIKELTDDIKKSVEEWKETIEPHQETIHSYLEQIESSLKELEEKVKTLN
ncbi:hypothetical protein GCM10010978_10920 [Compostibacillus humi]|uniref:Gas vesicle protein n=1 Tax=Compostibacillus humi TaxID=1245525 RepID=A0A8J2ZRY7_9BACI|nr:YtxH domain-containing protein [Compostibacillus humi]GGH73238.1 hypothetical protein GCM10010978_10920 [Compostibacillus humi]